MYSTILGSLPLKGLTEISTWAIYVYHSQLIIRGRGLLAYIDLLIIEPRFEILIDSLIRNGTKECHIPYTSLLLLS